MNELPIIGMAAHLDQPLIKALPCPYCGADCMVEGQGAQHVPVGAPGEDGTPPPLSLQLITGLRCATGHVWRFIVVQNPNEPAFTVVTDEAGTPLTLRHAVEADATQRAVAQRQLIVPH